MRTPNSDLYYPKGGAKRELSQKPAGSQPSLKCLIWHSGPAVVFSRIRGMPKAGVAQLDRASVYETEGYRFESCHPRYWVLTQ